MVLKKGGANLRTEKRPPHSSWFAVELVQFPDVIRPVINRANGPGFYQWCGSTKCTPIFKIGPPEGPPEALCLRGVGREVDERM